MEVVSDFDKLSLFIDGDVVKTKQTTKIISKEQNREYHFNQEGDLVKIKENGIIISEA